MRSKRNIVLSIVVLGLILTIGVSYAWFSGVIFGDSKQISINAKELKIIFTDSDTLANEEITPGWSNSKTFSVKNESNGTFNYNITIKGLVNTFVTEGFFKYKITSSNGYNMDGYIDIPKSESPKDIVIAYDIDIEKDEIQEYTIEFIYEDSEEVDQSEDMGKIFNGSLAIEEGTVDPNIKYSVTLNVENAIVDNNTKETIKRGSVEFNVVPNEGYTLGTNVTCDNEAVGVIENGKVTISNVTANTICELNNDINTYTVEMKVVNGKSNALNKIIEYNGSDTFTITPNTGYTLTGATLTGEGCSIEENIVSVSNVKKDGVCTLTLVKDKYQVILTGSNVTVSDSPKTVEYEGSTTFNVSPNTGFTMSEATVNCDGGASVDISGNTVTISNVLKGQKCTITPKQIKYDVTLVVVNGTGNTTKSITHGGSDTFNISANSTYTLDSPTISCTGSASTSYNSGVLTVSNVTGAQTCTVTLKHTSYLVTVTSNNNDYGTVSPTSSSVLHGNSLEITLNPKIHYHYSSNDCGGTVSGNTMTISNITAAKSCTVTYVEDTKYTVNVSVTGGSSNPNSATVYSGESKSFTITANNGYTLEGATATGTGCSLSGNTLTASNVTESRNCNVTLKEDNRLYTILSSGIKYTVRTRTDFSTILSGKSTRRIYRTGNDYYFAGNPSDNWVKFAEYYWRIIRTNSSEGTRLLFAGASPDTNNGYISLYYWWRYADQNDYTTVFWSNVPDDSSLSIKGSLKNWYSNSITGSNDDMVNSIKYCNDTSVASTSGVDKYFGAHKRLNTNKSPSYQCDNNSFGSISKVGMMTADEVAFAGGVEATTNGNVYYYRNSIDTGCTAWNHDPCSVTGDYIWFTLSPNYYSQYGGEVFAVAGASSGSPSGSFISTKVHDYSAFRPVITLKPSVLVSGSGTDSDPFIPVPN